MVLFDGAFGGAFGGAQTPCGLTSAPKPNRVALSVRRMLVQASGEAI
jgi:hypothetical protein